MRLLCDALPVYDPLSPIIVTPNRLYADVLSAQFVRDRLDQNQATWERPLITTIYAWMAALWQERRYSGEDVPTLLSPLQERALWQQLFENAHPDLFDFGGAARLAADATQTIAEWQIPLEHEAWEEYKDASHFRSLYRAFRRECRDRNCLTRSDLWRLAPEWTRHSGQPLALAGFDALSPGLRAFQANIHALKNPPEKRKRVSSSKHENLASEMEHCARWSRLKLESERPPSVGILVTNLSDHRDEINQIFSDVFYPSDRREEASAFYIHGSESLLQQPVAAAAMLLLELAGSDLSTADASAILRSPFVKGADAERSLRALADVQLRSRRDIRVTLQKMEYRTSACPLLTEIWLHVRRVLQGAPRIASLSEWSEWISDLLSATGWPGDQLLTSAEAAVVDSWKEALTQLSALSYVVPAQSFEGAQRELRRLLRSTAAPHAGDLFSPVQIVDAKTAAGLHFDAAALCGFSEGAWPPAETGQPFIPLRLRRAAGIPGSTAASAVEQRALQTRRVFGCAEEMIATYSESPAPLARPFLNLKASLPSVWNRDRPMASFVVAELESLADETAPPLALGQPPVGGVSIIKAQSLCPFQAFARYRLLADAPEDACFGLDARDRGGYLHKALEHAWRAIETSDRLKALAIEDLRRLISEAVNLAVAEDGRSAFHELVSDTERRRLNEVLLEWLQLEKTRKAPFQVEYIEEKKTVELAGLPLNLRIDRIDRLADGSVLLVDYKSGLLAAKDLLGERPREPQLLVYASAIDEEVDGVYLAQVRAREMKAQGMASHEHFPEGRKAKNAPDWHTERENAREKLRNIATEFVSGLAAVDPQPQACTYCGIKLLCRVAEAGAGSGGEDDGDE